MSTQTTDERIKWLTKPAFNWRLPVELVPGAHGIPVIDADKIARLVVEPGRRAYKQIVRHFGAGVLLRPGGALDREKLGDVVFKDAAQRRAQRDAAGGEREEQRETRCFWLLALLWQSLCTRCSSMHGKRSADFA